MDHTTTIALEKSIDHWEQNLFGPFEEARVYGDDCALCGLFSGDNCDGCPVAERTGESECDDSPWNEARWAFDKVRGIDGGSTYPRYFGQSRTLAELAFREAARKELEFLISLRDDT